MFGQLYFFALKPHYFEEKTVIYTKCCKFQKM